MDKMTLAQAQKIVEKLFSKGITDSEIIGAEIIGTDNPAKYAVSVSLWEFDSVDWAERLGLSEDAKWQQHITIVDPSWGIRDVHSYIGNY